MKKLLLILALTFVATGCMVEAGESDYDDYDDYDTAAYDADGEMVDSVIDTDPNYKNPEPNPWRATSDNAALAADTNAETGDDDDDDGDNGGREGSNPEPNPWHNPEPNPWRHLHNDDTLEPNPVPWK